MTALQVLATTIQQQLSWGKDQCELVGIGSIECYAVIGNTAGFQDGELVAQVGRVIVGECDC